MVIQNRSYGLLLLLLWLAAGCTDASGRGPCVDLDADGSCADADCDDGDPQRAPELSEASCDGIDNDCDETTGDDPDADGDGFGACDEDCDDENGGIHPGAEETIDGVDEDCDGIADNGTEAYDDDGDGLSEQQGDCDDTNGAVYPGADDLCDGIDNDCDGALDEDTKAGWILVTGDQTSSRFYEIDPTDASAQLLSVMSIPGFGLCSMDVQDGGLSVSSSGAGELLHTEACTGNVALVGTVPQSPNICGISFGPGGRLFALDGSNDRLLELDPLTAQASVIGPLGIDIGYNGMAYNCSTDTLYGIDADADRLFTVDPATGRASNILSLSIDFSLVGLDFHYATGKILASDGQRLYDIDPGTGASNLIGTLGVGSVNDLAFHPPCR
jgi:hypothetical protein